MTTDQLEPYVPKNPNDIIRAGDWNEIQRRTRDEIQETRAQIRAHRHCQEPPEDGEPEGEQVPRDGIEDNAVDGSKIDPESVVTIKGLTVQGEARLEQGVTINEFSSAFANESRQSAVPTEQAVREYIDDLFVGSVAAFAMTEPPPGWLECDGRPVSRTDCKKLFDRIRETFGGGDGENTFNLPDLRGQFVRGWDNGEGEDLGREFGMDQIDTHIHGFSGSGGTSGDGNHAHGGVVGGWQGSHDAGYHGHSVSVSGTTGAQSPSSGNVALMYCIKC